MKKQIQVSQTKVTMRQTAKYRWEIVSAKGYILQADISLGSLYQAHEYVNKYISSFLGWTYEVIPMSSK